LDRPVQDKTKLEPLKHRYAGLRNDVRPYAQQPANGSFTLTGADTSYIDGQTDSLEQGTSYGYKIVGYSSTGKLSDTSKTVIAKTLTATSHNITWQIDTLGEPGNALDDVWGIDENNVWAVGGVSLPDGGSNVIKWNGLEWRSFPIVEANLNGIFGFAENDIWVVGGGTYGNVHHWDGTDWKKYTIITDIGDTTWGLNAVWGSAPDDVWAVGKQGTIIHWDGVEWRKVSIDPSYNQYKFTDIWGYSENEIYVAGRIYQDEAALIKYNGNSWETVVGNSSLAAFATVWGPHSSLLYFIEFNDYVIVNGITTQFYLPGRLSGVVKIRGSGSNNVFTVGHFGEVFHFNGLEWKRVSELYTYPNSRALSGCFATEKEVFIVGETPDGAIFIRGVL